MVDLVEQSTGPPPNRVPTSGYFVQAGYILTGETIRGRPLIDPLRPAPGPFFQKSNDLYRLRSQVLF